MVVGGTFAMTGHEAYRGGMTVTSLPFAIGPKGRVVLPVAVRRAAGMDEGAEVVATVDGEGRVVLETVAAVRARVWSAAPDIQYDAVADVRLMRDADEAAARAASTRRSTSRSSGDAGRDLLDHLGL